MSDKSKTSRLREGATILVTGTTGYIGSHIANEALKLGYKVVGTVRSQEKAEATKKTFGYDPNYSTVIVEDLQTDGAFDEAVKGVDAIIHVATVVSRSPDPNQVITPVVAGTNSLLNSALKSPSVKSVVLTSSSMAATLPKPNQEFHLDKNSWNDEAVEMAWRPPFTEDKFLTVYAASKAEGEKAFWKFARDNKPHFVQNAILPSFTMGRVISSPGSTGRAATEAYRGNLMTRVDPLYHIDVIDCARIHVIAAIDSTVEDERIYAFNIPFNWNDVLSVLRKIRPKAKIVDDVPGLGRDRSTVENERCAELLRKWYSQNGYTSLAVSIEANLEGID